MLKNPQRNNNLTLDYVKGIFSETLTDIAGQQKGGRKGEARLIWVLESVYKKKKDLTRESQVL
jgi:hypothetical protein